LLASGSTDGRTNALEAKLRHVWRDSGWYLLAGVARVESEEDGETGDIAFFIDYEETAYTLGAGKYFGQATAIDLSVAEQDYGPTSVALSFSHIGSIGKDWQYGANIGLAKSDDSGDEGSFSLRGSLYPSPNFEFGISRPEVIVKEIEGVKCEPFEHLVIDVPEEFGGTIIERLGKRKAEMKSMLPMGEGFQRIEFEIPARGLIGFRGMFLTDTKGEGVMNHSFLEFRPYSGTVESRQYGALISMESGTALAYSIFNLQDRGAMFIEPQSKVYSGMVIGEHSRSNDLDVNPIKGKQQSNVRSSGADDAIKLVPPRDMNLEKALEWIEEDELLEVTPENIRIRKRYLDPTERRRHAKKVAGK